MDRLLGKRLDGRYEIREIVGVGGMAVVYKAYDNVEDRIVAIKILREEFATNEEFLRRFRNESKAISLLSHPNIVKIFDVSFGDLIQYIVMEYIDGITLKEYIERQGILTWKEAVQFTIQILRGLQHAHDRGIVHRDVKPQNIIVLPDGTIKVTDFGIARFARSEQKTITDKAIGSVHYISPEQVRGEATDEKADINSVGVMLYEMLTGQLPFEAENAVSVAIMQLQRDAKLPTELNGSIPLGVEQITMHAMQKRTVNRYKSSSEMLCDLEKFKKDPAITFDYSYFVDDSPTKFIDIEQQSDEEAEETEERTKTPIIPILSGIAVAFVAAIIVLLIIFLPRLTGSTGKEIPCPKFVGLEYTEVYNNAELNETFNIVYKWNNNAEYAPGIIFYQSQAEGKNLKEGATIEVIVSQGTATKSVPDVSGNNENNAKRILEMNGFKVTVAEKADEDVEAGLAVNTNPAAGSSVAEGTEIILYISTGAPTVYVDLPNVTSPKLKLEDAKKLISERGLIIGDIEYVDNEPGDKPPAGYVVAQDPNPSENKQVGKGTSVNLKVSTGKVAYISDVTVEVPAGATAISIWIENQNVQEATKLDGTLKQYTFTSIKSYNQKVDAVLKVKTENDTEYVEYKKITVDLANKGKVTPITNPS